MISIRFFLFSFSFLLFGFIYSGNSFSHGGVVEEDDLCVIKVNYLRAHFKIYQPESLGHEQFCEDLPLAAESVFVMEYMHDSLSEMPIDFRIIRDVTGKGRFARMQDVKSIEDIDSATVFYRPPIIEPDIYLVNYQFLEEGDFIGIVSARHPESDKVYTAVFPFEVGFTGFGYWPFFIGLLVFIQFQYFLMSGRLRKWFRKGSFFTVLIFFSCTLSTSSYAENLVVTYTTSSGEPEINKMHSWILHIKSDDGSAIEDAIINVEGGMPKHNHGLPTKPLITTELGNGKYKLEGMRFHMSGYWEIVVNITTNNGTSKVIIPIQI